MIDPLRSTFKTSIILRSPSDAVLHSLMLQTSPMNITLTALLLLSVLYLLG